MNSKQFPFVGLVCVSFAAIGLALGADAGESSEHAQVKIQSVEFGR
jgi:hypothetical protein